MRTHSSIKTARYIISKLRQSKLGAFVKQHPEIIMELAPVFALLNKYVFAKFLKRSRFASALVEKLGNKKFLKIAFFLVTLFLVKKL